MRAPEVGVGQPAADADDHHRHVVVADVDADLLEAARRGERRDRVDERPQAAHRHAGGDAHHVRLGHAAVEEARPGTRP